MAIDFPNSPSTNDTHTVGDRTWIYADGKWSTSTGAGQIIAGTGLSKSGNTLSIDTAVTANLTSAQTLTNKTLTTPIINGPTITATGQTPVIHGILLPNTHGIYFEGATTDANQTYLYCVDPTADRTILLPNAGGTIALLGTIDLGTDTTGNYMSGISGTSPVSVAHTAGEGSSATVSLAASYGDTQNPYASKTANYVLAAPNGTAGVPTFRAIVAADIPTLNQNTTGSAATLTTARTLWGQSFNGSANISGALTGATTVALSGSTSGTTTLQASAVAGTTTITLPAATGTVALTDSAITSSTFIGTTSVALNRSSGALTLAGITLTTPVLGVASATSINGLTITSSTGALTVTNAKTLSVSNTLTLTGTDASSVAFGAGGTVAYTSVTTLSSLISVGTIGTGVWQGTAIAGQYGGTGVANTGKTITLGGNLTTSGAFTTTLTATANTSVTLPTSGTLTTTGKAIAMAIVFGS